MRFRKRLSAAILAIVMMISSIQIPGGISYATEISDKSAITNDENLTGNDNSADGGELTGDDSQAGDETPAGDDSQAGDENPAGGDSQTEDENLTGDDNQTGDGNLTGDDSQTGDENPSGDDSQTEDENPTGDDNQIGDEDPLDDDNQTDNENASEEETEETEMVEAEIEGAYQFGDAPSAKGEMSTFSISIYDDSGEDYVYQQMLQRVERIDLYAGGFYSLSPRDAASLMNGVLNEHPDLYFVQKSYYYDYGPDFNTVRHVYMTYSTDYDDVAFEKKTEAALACVTDDMSDDMKAAVLHDYLVINVEYDYDNYTIPKVSFNAYGALVNGVAVCNGYALAYKYLLNQAGIECYMVTSQSMDHAWNLVKLDGEYYHVDTTWGDPVPDMVGRVCHDYLLCSETNFENHHDWTVTSGSNAVDYKATDTKYDKAFWTDCTSPLVFDGTDCYYISRTGKSLKKTSFSNITATGTDVVSVGKWTSGSGGSWNGAYSGLYRINGRLFYNDGNSIYSIRPDGTDKKTEFTPEKTGGNQIYYSAYRNGQVVYALQTSPNLSEKQTVLIAEIEGIERTYNITYVLDGGTNDKDNPIAYTAGTETIVLKDAVKAGYKFEGWYKDSAYTLKVTEIPEGSTGDITLYAKWSKAALNALNKDYTLTTLDDETVSTRAEGKPKVLFFFKMNNLDCAQTNQDLSEHIEAFGGVDIYAIEYYDSSTKEEVAEYKNTYGCDGITYCYDKERTNYNCFWDYFYNITRINDGSYYVAPLIVFIDSNNRVQYATDGARSWTDILTDLQKYCGYNYEDIEGIYNITYVLDGGTNDKDNPSMYMAGAKAIALKDAAKAGYKFEGWYKDSAYQQKVTEIPEGSTGDITLYAKWSKLRENGLNAENPYYTFTTLGEETVSTRADGKPKVLFFFDMDIPDSSTTLQDLSEHIEAFGGVDIYAIEPFYGSTKEEVAEYKNTYGCDEIIYCYDKDGTNYNCLNDYFRNVTNINNGIFLVTPLIIFIDPENRVQHATDGERSWTDILTDLQEYCGYDYKDIEGIYNITYVLDGGTNDEDNPSVYMAGTKAIVLKDAAKEGYQFEGWYKDSAYQQKVTGIPKGSTGDITLYAKWSKIKEVESGLNAENLNYTFTTLDDETVSSKADGKPKVLFFFKPDCYYCQKTSKDLSQHISNFSGVDIYVIEAFISSTKAEVADFKKAYGCDEITYCYDKNGMTKYHVWDYVDLTHIGSNSVATPAIIFIDSENRVQHGTAGVRSWSQILEDLRVYCGYGAEDTEETYKITYKLNGGTNDSANPSTYTSETETITLKDAVKDGYVFDGWYKDAGFKEKVTEIVNGSKGDITLYAKWREIPVEPGTYRIIYELNGGTNDSENPASYTSETETITLKAPSKEGFIFEGWYADAKFNKQVTEIAGGSIGDVKLYAKWKAVQVDIDPDTSGNTRTGIAVRFTDYYSLGENSIPCYKYTGAAVKPAVDVYSNDRLLILGTDYTVTYKNNTKVGVAALTVKGKGSYSGASNAVSFEIINADIRTDTDHPTKMTVIAGTKVAPIFMNGTKKLTTKDYKLEGDNFVGGKYANPTGEIPNLLTVTGIGNYAGSSFTIAVTVIDKKKAKKLAVTIDKSFKPVYDGSALDLDALFGSPTGKGSITVTDSKEKTKVLEKGKDFYVVCTSSLKAAGTVKFTVTGMGEYTGSVSKSFKISPLKVTENAKFGITYDSKAYEYKASGTTLDNLTVKYLGNTTSEDDDKTLIPGEDYKVSYRNNKKVSTETKKAQVKITFLGNYKGSKPVTKDFTISAAKLSMQTTDSQAVNTKVIVPDKVYDKAGKSYKSTPIVTVDGVSIKASNYNVSYAWAAVTYAGTEGKYEDGNKVKLADTDSYAKVKVKITLKGQNYGLADGTTSIEGEYCVRRKAQGVTDLSKAKVTFQDKDGKPLKALEYNGRAYYTPEGNSSAQSDPNAVYVSVTVNGEPIDSSLYNVIWTDATAKGKATVVVTGKGTWAVGSKNQTINIKAMALKGKTIDYFKLN